MGPASNVSGGQEEEGMVCSPWQISGIYSPMARCASHGLSHTETALSDRTKDLGHVRVYKRPRMTHGNWIFTL